MSEIKSVDCKDASSDAANPVTPPAGPVTTGVAAVTEPSPESNREEFTDVLQATINSFRDTMDADRRKMAEIMDSKMVEALESLGSAFKQKFDELQASTAETARTIEQKLSDKLDSQNVAVRDSLSRMDRQQGAMVARNNALSQIIAKTPQSSGANAPASSGEAPPPVPPGAAGPGATGVGSDATTFRVDGYGSSDTPYAPRQPNQADVDARPDDIRAPTVPVSERRRQFETPSAPAAAYGHTGQAQSAAMPGAAAAQAAGWRNAVGYWRNNNAYESRGAAADAAAATHQQRGTHFP